MAGHEDDCDSFEQILHMIHDENNRSYTSNTQFNHAASFGVGGRISSVVDPEFRPPTIILPPQTINTNQTSAMFNPPFNNNGQHSNTAQQAQPMIQINNPNHNVVYQNSTPNGMVLTNIASSSYGNMTSSNNQQMGEHIQMQNSMAPQTNRLGGPVLSSQLPVSGNLSVPFGTVPFAIQGAPNTFQDIARRPTFATNPSNILSSTLYDYGPPVNHIPQRERGFMPHQNHEPRQSAPIYPMGPAPMNPSVSMSAGPVRPASTGSALTVYDNSPMGPAPLHYAPVHRRPNTAPINHNVRKGLSPPPLPPPEPSESCGNKTGPNSSSSDSKNPKYPDRPGSVPVTCPSSSGPPRDRIIYSPPSNRTVAPNAQVNTGEQSTTSMTSTGRIPRIQSSTNRDEFEEVAILKLQEKYREIEFEIHTHSKRLNEIDKSLQDLRRSANGRNIEQDSAFKQLKKDQAKRKEDLEMLQKSKDRVDERLWTLYEHRMTPKETSTSSMSISAQQTPSRRAKMSTTSQREGSATRPSSRGNKPSLKLKYGNTWCEKCDQHFDSLNAYCDHLHSRDHKRQMRECRPWAISSRDTEQASPKQTLSYLNSICSRVSNELVGDTYDLRDLDRVLNYSIDDRDKVLKIRRIERERGNFEEDDPMFQYQCYDHLLPISGFYCVLCSQALCDSKEVERHMTSYEHNSAHLKSVALNRDRFKNFMVKKDRSYKEIYGDRSKQSPRKSKKPIASTSGTEQGSFQPQSKTSDPVPSASGTATTSSTAKPSTAMPVRLFLPAANLLAPATTSSGISIVTTTSAATLANSSNLNIASSSSTPTGTTVTSVHQYKKATSHIVDQHEAVIEKFPDALPDRQKPASKSPDRRRKERVEDEPLRKKASTEIVPLGNMNRPTALKRLKKSTRPPKSKPIVESDSSSNSDIDSRKVAPKKKRSRPVIRDDDDDEQTTVESNDSDVEIVGEVQLGRGDPDSPFPNLELSVTGNIHMSALKDPRLSAKCSVKVPMLKLEQYKDMLLDSASLWVRLNQLIAKREPGQLSREARQEIEEPKPIYYDVHGKCEPVEIEDEDQGSLIGSKRHDNNDAIRKDRKTEKTKDRKAGEIESEEMMSTKGSKDGKVKQDHKSKKGDNTTGNDNKKKEDKDTGAQEVLNKDDDKNEGFKQQMDLLEAFFCEK